MSESTSEPKKSQTYPGGCHCGYIKFDVTLSPPLAERVVNNCNCSMCRRGGYLLVYPPATDVAWRGASRARCAVYRFNTKQKQQLFCPRCGASLGIDFTEVPGRSDYGISVRAFDNIDLDTLNIRKSNGVAGVPPEGVDMTVEYIEED